MFHLGTGFLRKQEEVQNAEAFCHKFCWYGGLATWYARLILDGLAHYITCDGRESKGSTKIELTSKWLTGLNIRMELAFLLETV